MTTTTTSTTETEMKFANQLFEAYQTQHALTMSDFADTLADEDAAYRVPNHLTVDCKINPNAVRTKKISFL